MLSSKLGRATASPMPPPESRPLIHTKKDEETFEENNSNFVKRVEIALKKSSTVILKRRVAV